MNIIEKLLGVSALSAMLSFLGYVINEVYSYGLTPREAAITGAVIGIVVYLMLSQEFESDE